MRAAVEVQHAFAAFALRVCVAAVRLMEAFAAVLSERQHTGGGVVGCVVDLAAAISPRRVPHEFADLVWTRHILAVSLRQLDLRT